jgi:hypothetical protein
LLLVLLALSILACAIAATRATSMRSAALLAREDLNQVRHDLNSLAPASNPTGAGTSDVNRLVRDAAAQAGADGAVASVEAGRPSDGGEVPVIVGFTPLTLKQLVTIVHTLGAAGARTDSIELSAADKSGGDERWTATVTISIRSSR